MTEEEKVEVHSLGECMARMTWLDIYCDNAYFTQGIRVGRGRVGRVRSKNLDDYQGVVAYRVSLKQTSSKIAWLENLSRLRQFLEKAWKELYMRGIIA